ncbi:MAG: mercury resistance system periplasmic binding protein MerP [Burkholderiales bacterium]
MFKHFAAGSLAFGLLAASALAAEKTVTLAVEGMYCAACPFIIKESLSAVPGVEKVEVSFENKTAVVTFDDAKADVAALIKATTEAGYSAHLAREGS